MYSKSNLFFGNTETFETIKGNPFFETIKDIKDIEKKSVPNRFYSVAFAETALYCKVV